MEEYVTICLHILDTCERLSTDSIKWVLWVIIEAYILQQTSSKANT